MTLPARICLYVVLTVSTIFFTKFFVSEYDRIMNISVPVETSTSADIDLPPVDGPAKKPFEPEHQMLGFGLGLGISVVFLGLLLAHDISSYYGSRAATAVYSGGDESSAARDYEAAEEVWAQGDHLDSISLFREYLTKHPKAVHVKIRIAEIYEKDLGNHLAAALEYEDILTERLPAKRWGWAAIHLCNLYYKLNRAADAEALLHRIVNEYGETPAAEKARKRLALLAGESYIPPSENQIDESRE